MDKKRIAVGLVGGAFGAFLATATNDAKYPPRPRSFPVARLPARLAIHHQLHSPVVRLTWLGACHIRHRHPDTYVLRDSWLLIQKLLDGRMVVRDTPDSLVAYGFDASGNPWRVVIYRKTAPGALLGDFQVKTFHRLKSRNWRKHYEKTLARQSRPAKKR